MQRVEVLGVGFDPIPLNDVADAVAGLVAQPKPEGALLIATPNPEIVMAARRDPKLRDILRDAALVLPDGVGIVWASRRLGRPVPDRVTGVDALPLILARAAREGWRVYLLGGKPGVAEMAAHNMRERFPGLNIVGTADGYFGAQEEAARVQDIVDARTDLLLLGMGAPREQYFWARWRRELGALVTMGVGGSLDVFAGTVKRAPGWVQRLGVEWLWRLIRQPSRFGRQMRALPPFVLLVLAEARRREPSVAR